jgi:hypothetical protein
MKNKILSILYVFILTAAMYITAKVGIDISLFSGYKIRMPLGGFVYFSVTLELYYTYILPYILLFVNFFYLINKIHLLNTVISILVYCIFIGCFWGYYLFTIWPYRAFPVISVLTIVYFLDLFIMKRLINKYRGINP